MKTRTTKAGVTGKIGRLPKHLRDQINRMLDDHRPYAQIVRFLNEQGETSIFERDISRWRTSGYIEWQNSDFALQDLRTIREFASEAAAAPDDLRCQEAALNLGTIRILRHLRDSVPNNFQKLMEDKPHYFVALMHCLVGLNAQQLRLRKSKNSDQLTADDSATTPVVKGLRPESREAVESDLNLC